MEIRENSQKRVLLSVLGVAILVVAVIGISFAAYTGTQTSNENTINTGTLMVSYQEDDAAINITNALPMKDADAINPANLTADAESFQFTVSTNANNAISIPYIVTLTPANSGNGPFLTTDQVHLYLTKNGEAVDGYPCAISTLASSTERDGSFILTSATDTFSSGNAAAINTTYVLKMWVAETVDVSGGNSYSYSAKVNVDSVVGALQAQQ